MNSTSLRNRSHYSCGLAVGTTKQYIEACNKKQVTHFGLADYCTLGGALDFYNSFNKENIKIAIGAEFPMGAAGSVILYCKNQDGYMNLCRLITLTNNNGQILNIQDLYDNFEHLICIALNLDLKRILEPIFSKDLYFEISPYEDEKLKIMKTFANIPKEQIVISSNAHMPNKEDKILQDIMIDCSSFSSEDKSFKYTKYLMDNNDLVSNFVKLGFAKCSEQIVVGINNSKKIIEECSNLNLKFKDQLVNYPHLLHPLNTDNCDKETLLRRIIKDNNRWDFNDPIYIERLEYEFDTIANNSRINLIDYYLVVEDFCRFCRNNDVPVGPGRGSGAGSLLAYGCQITHLDPIKYGLIFERFISKGRIEAGSLPDFDIDFADQEVVRQYITDLYGDDRVMPIGTYQTLAIRGAIKDAFRVLYPEVPFATMNKITKLINDDVEADNPSEFYEKQFSNLAFAEAMEPYPLLLKTVGKLVGYNRQPGVHACGICITQDRIEDFMPVRINKGKHVLEYTGGFCEQAGVIKFDILGLKTLRFFQSCLSNIAKKYSDSKDSVDYLKSIYDIPLDDEATYKAFQNGDTESVFQFNSGIARNMLTRTKVNSLNDLSMITSVGRPGPMENGQHNSFIKRKNNPKEAKPPHPALKEVLEDTLGVMIYQESVMKAAQIMGGYSLAETDDIRKAMGKKKLELLHSYKEGFLKHCYQKFPDTKNMIKINQDEPPITVGENIWRLMETFSGYGFNKSHAMCYALIGYYCQYLKTHYTFEWWCACLSNSDSPNDVKSYYAAFKKHIMLPSVEYSQKDYAIINNKNESFIVMPFSSIKGVGGVAAESIENNAPYSSFEDFYNRAKSDKGRRVNKNVTINLIFAGAFDSFNKNKKELLSEYYRLRKAKESTIPKEHLNFDEEYENGMKYEALSFLTMDYIKTHKKILGDKASYQSDLAKMKHKDEAWIIGKVLTIKKRKISKGRNEGDEFIVMDIANRDEIYDVVVWPEQVKFYQHLLNEKSVLVIKGRVKKDWAQDENNTQFTASGIYTLKEVQEFGGLKI